MFAEDTDGCRGYPGAVYLLERTLSEAAADLHLDDLLLEAVDRGEPECLRLWQRPAPAVVMGAGGRWRDEVDRAACEAAGVPVLRRRSGGGTVLLGPGCLMVSLALSLERRPAWRDIQRSQAELGAQLAEALALPELAVRGGSDLALGARKISGSAQRRKQRALLHHITLLCRGSEPLIAQMPALLPHPPREPDYRAGRAHDGFVATLPLTCDEAAARLAALAPDAAPALATTLAEAEAWRQDPDWTWRR